MKKLITVFAALGLNYFMQSQISSLDLQPNSSNGIDANVQSNNPNLNLGSDNVLRFSRSSSGVKERSFLKFDLNSIPRGVDILSAKLILYGVNHTLVNSGNGILQLVPDTWAENTVNWNISTSLKSSAMSTLSINSPTSATQNYTLDVLEMVQKMVNTPLVNFGWLLAMENENTLNNKTFSFGSGDNSNNSLCPKLSITYCNHLVVNAYVGPGTGQSSSDAGVFLNVTEGVPPYNFLWSNSATTKDIYNVAPGLYTVTITDSRGTPVKKIIPVSGGCGTLSFSVVYSDLGFNNARLVSESFNQNTANSNFLNTNTLKANNISSGGGNVLTRSLIAFDLDALPNNVQVNQAILNLTDDETTQNRTFQVQLFRNQQTWNPRTISYNEQPIYNDSIQDRIQFSYDGSQTSYDIDVTSHLQKMVGQVNSGLGWVLRLADESPSDAGISATFKNPKITIQLTMPSFACDDSQLNWNLEETFDENGNIISSEKNYLDNLGRLTQKLLKNANNEVFRTQTVYDSYGFAAVNSMPAYSGNQLKYQTNFMLNQYGQTYSYADFDTPATLNNNIPLQNGVSNSLGNYYSNLNPYDAYQAIADNPFTRIENTGSGSKTRVSKPGNSFKMGSGRENITFNITNGDELKYIFGTSGSNFYSYKVSQSSTNVMEYDPILVNTSIIASKQIIISPGNPEMITYSIDDKLIATCYSGLSSGESYTTISGVTSLMLYKGTKCIDIHLPYANRTSLTLPLPLSIPGNTTSAPTLSDIAYSITDLHTDKKLMAITDYTIGSNRVVTFSSTFINLYANKSFCLRISYDYSSTYLASIATNSWTPEDAKAVYDLRYGRANKNYYDLSGRLRKSVSPKGFDISSPNNSSMTTTYDYSHLGQTIGVKNPDQGLTQMVYDNQGNLRFTQNAKQKINNYFSYINYDKHGRPFESGENHTAGSNGNSVSFMNYYGQGTYISPGVFSSMIINQQDGLSSVEKNNRTITSYSVPISADDIPSSYGSWNQYRKFRNGQVNYVKSDNSTIWFNYDKLGKKLATITQITEPEFVAKNSSINDQIKTSESVYDNFTGITLSNTYQKNNSNEYIKYQFAYDANLRPTTTQLTYGGTSYNINSNMYNKMGQLKRVVLGDNYQGMDYVYTLNGGLKAVNHPGLDPSLDPGGDNGTYGGTNSNVNMDLFGEIIEFHASDYERNNTNITSGFNAGNSNYDGLIYATRFKTRDQVNSRNTGANTINDPTNPITLITSTNYKNQELCFQYAYDEFNKLGGSYFGTYNNYSNSFTQRSEYTENGNTGSNITYDKNNNITRLTRMAYNNTVLDNLTYTYSSTDNKLNGIVDAAVNSYPQTFNFKTASTTTTSLIGYDAIGQMTISLAENINLIEYFPSGKIKKITFTNNNTTEYEYDAMGEKLKTKCHNASSGMNRYTWYIGPYVYEFDQAGGNTFIIKEAKISGGVIRINAASNNAGYIVFHITDHLGNVRVTFTKRSPATNGSGTGIEVLSYNDYYAFGGQLPGRNYTYENYRYGYQGQEKSEDGTIWDQFELRSYNHDLGRWFSPDPYGQFESPYIAMANNPVSTIDPDGGWVNGASRANGRSWGAEQDQRDRENQTGAYSAENTQKRYEQDAQQIREKYLLNDGSWLEGARDAKGYLQAMLDLNNFYLGLGNGGGGINADIGFGTGFGYLSQTEIGLNVGACQNLGSGADGATADAKKSELESQVQRDSYKGSAEEFATSKREAIRSSRISLVAKVSVNKIMDQNGWTGQVKVTQHNSDGSEVVAVYDEKNKGSNGSPSLVGVSFYSKEFVDQRNGRAAGSSCDSRTFVDVGGGFVGPAESNGGTNAEQLAEAIGLGADVNNTSLSIVKAALGESGVILKAFTKPFTAIGAIVGAGLAINNISKVGWQNGAWNDYAAIGLGGVAVFAEFIGVGEAWDIIGASATAASAGLDIYGILDKD